VIIGSRNRRILLGACLVFSPSRPVNQWASALTAPREFPAQKGTSDAQIAVTSPRSPGSPSRRQNLPESARNHKPFGSTGANEETPTTLMAGVPVNPWGFAFRVPKYQLPVQDLNLKPSG
jgi:hypothetical protein